MHSHQKQIRPSLFPHIPVLGSDISYAARKTFRRGTKTASISTQEENVMGVLLNIRRRWHSLIVALLLSVAASSGERPKNVIVMIADGTGSQQYTFARWWKGEPMHIEKHLSGSLRTFIADSVVADSAPAASAMATGFRTSDKLISTGPHGKGLLPGERVYNGVEFHPLATVLEGARLQADRCRGRHRLRRRLRQQGQPRRGTVAAANRRRILLHPQAEPRGRGHLGAARPDRRMGEPEHQHVRP
jgi:hypothetical protein